MWIFLQKHLYMCIETGIIVKLKNRVYNEDVSFLETFAKYMKYLNSKGITKTHFFRHIQRVINRNKPHK